MRRRSIGRFGPGVSAVGLGANNFGRRPDLAGTRAVADPALDAGVTLIDTADLSGDGRTEQYLGEVLDGRRDQVVLVSKFTPLEETVGALDEPVGEGKIRHAGCSNLSGAQIAALPNAIVAPGTSVLP